MQEALDTSTTKEQVVLELFGIDKKWVRFNGKWTDQATLNQPRTPQPTLYEDDEDVAPRKWWKFWSR